jgi:hypothetical protein
MRALFATATVVAIAIAGASAQACAPNTAHEEGGNWYCQAVNAISYTNFGTPGQYNKVTSFNEGAGSCSSVSTDYAGGISPMDEEVSDAPKFLFYDLELTTTSGIVALSWSSVAQAICLLYTRHFFMVQACELTGAKTCA